MEIKINVEVQERFIKALENIVESFKSNGLIEAGVIDEPEQTEKTPTSKAVPVEAAETEEPKAESQNGNVPTEEPAYTFEQIQLACANLARNGKRDVLASLIKDFGLESLMELKEEQYNEFALKLREVGGTI